MLISDFGIPPLLALPLAALPALVGRAGETDDAPESSRPVGSNATIRPGSGANGLLGETSGGV